MNPLLNEIQRIITDLRTEKPTTRNKAVEQLDQKLNSSRDAVNAALAKCQELSWQSIFDAAKEAIFKVCLFDIVNPYIYILLISPFIQQISTLPTCKMPTKSRSRRCRINVIYTAM